jgi:hypothetical protein
MSVELTVRVADAGEQAAVALLAAASLRIPENTVIVDRAYLSGTTNERQFGTMAAALTYIRQRAGTWRIVAGEGLPFHPMRTITTCTMRGFCLTPHLTRGANFCFRAGRLIWLNYFTRCD